MTGKHPKTATKTTVPTPAGNAVLLTGGNPQIARGEGSAPVEAYIGALSGWQRAVVTQLDALIVRVLPDVTRAVKWNSPLYGTGGQDRFLSIHVFTNYVKVAFFNGRLLDPIPPGVSKSKDTRYLDIREADVLDEAQLTSWLQQASKLPGETM